MTPAAIELWNDESFIQKRIDEQRDYCRMLLVRFIIHKSISRERLDELHESATQVRLVLEERRRELWNTLGII